MTQFEALKFSQIKSRLPGDWASWNSDRQHSRFDDEDVLLCRGSATLAELDLDNPLRSVTGEGGQREDAYSHVFLILVEGNLTVEGWIGNADTDGATGLVVKGNLTARNAILGGQEVYVAGNMQVEELLWGDYNHGTLVVGGNVSAALFAATDQYDYDLRGLRRFDHQLIEEGPDDGDWNWMDPETLSRLIEPDCVDDDLNLRFAGLQRQRILDRLRLGLPVLRREGLAWKPDPIVSIFKDRDITVDNILKIADPSRMPAVLEDDDTPVFEFWASDVFCRAAASGKAGEVGAFRLVYLQDSTHALMLQIEREEEPRSLLGKLAGGPRTDRWRMTCKGRRLSEEDDEGDEEWPEIAQPFSEEFRPLLGAGWNGLLDAVSTYDHARRLVDPDEVRRLLALPVAEPYDDFYSDRCGFRAGELACAFRQEGVTEDGEPEAALLRVSRERYEPDDGEREEAYFFEVLRHVDGSECVFISYLADLNGEEEMTPISFLGGVHLERAQRAFRLARRNLAVVNRLLVEDGIPPDRRDDFAIRHWRDKVYITASKP